MQVPSLQHVPGHLIQLVREELTDACCPPKNHPEKSQACLKNHQGKSLTCRTCSSRGWGAKQPARLSVLTPEGHWEQGRDPWGCCGPCCEGTAGIPALAGYRRKGARAGCPSGPTGREAGGSPGQLTVAQASCGRGTFPVLRHGMLQPGYEP